jgi:hypothetical protein
MLLLWISVMILALLIGILAAGYALAWVDVLACLAVRRIVRSPKLKWPS